MVLRAGREFLAIPGPTTVPDEVLRAMHRPAIDIYAGELVGITHSILADLKTLFRTGGTTYIYIANGHGAWEAVLTNILSRGDKVLVLESGRFATGWGEQAARLGVGVEVLPGEWSRAVDPASVEQRLRADKGGAIKAILVVQVDTASGVVNDIPRIAHAIRSSGHAALLCVDAVASLGCMPFDMDAWGVDVAMAASQKGLMTPPGLAFVAANARAKAAHSKAALRTPYWDWTARDMDEHYRKYAGTAPVHLLFGLRRALDLMQAEGLEAIHLRHALLAGAVRAAVGAWAEGGALSLNIARENERSNTVTAIRVGEGRDPRPLVDFCRETCGVVLGTALGALAGKAFRIAHMGHVNAPMVLGTLATVEVAQKALGWPVPVSGIAAAAAHLAKTVPIKQG